MPCDGKYNAAREWSLGRMQALSFQVFLGVLSLGVWLIFFGVWYDRRQLSIRSLLAATTLVAMNLVLWRILSGFSAGGAIR